MNSWLTFNYILMIGILLFVGIVIWLLAWDEWREHRKKGREVKVQRSRGPSVLHTRWGSFYIKSYSKYSETEMHLNLVDHMKRKHELNVYSHEIKPVNILQVLTGPGNPQFIHTPGVDARQVAQQHYRHMNNVGLVHESKLEAERLSTEAKLSRTKLKQEVREIVNQINEGAKARQPPSKK